MVKNYTSSVPAVRSVQHIEERLVECGAKNVLKMYEGKMLKGVAFIIDVNGQDMPFRLPARVENVRKALLEAVKKPRKSRYGQKSTVDRISEQAERTAWKLLSDWVDIQVSLIELQQAKFMEVFLPYVYDHAKDQTFFEKMEQRGFSSLLEYKA
jgi:hypothetical protein